MGAGGAMREKGGPSKGGRSYPEFYEKLIPVALGIIVVLIFIVLLIAVAVALRLIPGAAW
jgi:hypothetical protein